MTTLDAGDWAPCSVPTEFMSGCRRTASFPYFGEAPRNIPLVKVWSQSDCEGLNKFHFSPLPITSLIESFKTLERPTLQEEDTCSDGDSEASSTSSRGTDIGSPIREPEGFFEEEQFERTKSVRFADDCGKDLFTVKVMTEPSDVAPNLSPTILRRWQGESKRPTKNSAFWKLEFSQPGADYVKFRTTLEKDKVSLENVLISTGSTKAVGTIKVLNTTFEKKVYVRFTVNNWKSYRDIAATYQPSTSKIYDNFTFEIELPNNSEQNVLEFCVCYVENGVEHWDSINGKNYKLTSSDREKAKTNSPQVKGYKSFKKDDAYQMNNVDWARFASWNNLSTSDPYW